MSRIRRAFLLALVALAVMGPASGTPAAQQQNRISSVLVPITGVADLGGTFSGTLLIQRFAAQGNAIVATGAISGVLNDATGTTRNLVTQVTMPLDINASLARQNTDFTLAQSSCEALHLELGSSTVSVLGSTIALSPVAVDIATAAQFRTGVTQTSTVTTVPPNTPSPLTVTTAPSTVFTTPAGFSTAVQSASATGAAPVASTAQFDTIAMPPVPSPAQPDVWAVTPPAVTATQTSAAMIAPQRSDTQNQLGSLLCSIGGFRNTLGGSAQLAQQLNEVLVVLGS